MITRDEILILAEQLDGTCSNLDRILSEEHGLELTDIPVELLQLLDDHVLLCSGCGWWKDAGCFDSEGFCDECADQGVEE